MPLYGSNWEELWERKAFIMITNREGEMWTVGIERQGAKLESVTAYEPHKSYIERCKWSLREFEY